GLLCGLPYLDDRCRLSDAYSLVRDYDLVGPAHAAAVQPYRDFLRARAHALARFRDALFALVWHEGFAAAREQAGRLRAGGSWPRPWLRTTPVELPPRPGPNRRSLGAVSRCAFDPATVGAVAPKRRL